MRTAWRPIEDLREQIHGARAGSETALEITASVIEQLEKACKAPIQAVWFHNAVDSPRI